MTGVPHLKNSSTFHLGFAHAQSVSATGALTRVLGALANAGFLAVGLAAATSMVAPNAKGRATSILLGGVTLACIAGVPAGAVLGQAFGPGRPSAPENVPSRQVAG